LNEPEEIRQMLGHELELIIDGGPCGHEPTTVLDLVGEVPQVLRLGKGDASPFLTD
jgi:tRNA A37 threonylcarbamoyladenosine synthetase subunit TsaC/SUA5/YrdC